VKTLKRAAAIAWLGLLAAGCGHDAADRKYLAALDGEETGLTREQEMALIDEAIALEPRRAYYYDTRAGYWIGFRQFDRALADLDRSIALNDRPYARFMRGLARCEAGDPAGALADFDTAILRQPANTQFYRGRSLARAATGDAAGAMSDAEHLVSAAPQWAESFYARAVACSMLGRDRDAIADLDRAASMRPELVYVVETRAAVLERAGEMERARADRETLVHLRAEREGCAACFDPFRY